MKKKKVTKKVHKKTSTRKKSSSSIITTKFKPNFTTITAKPTSALPRKELLRQVDQLKNFANERAQYVRAKTRLTNQMKAIARKVLNKQFKDSVSDKELNELIAGAIAEESTLFGIVPISWGRNAIDMNLKSLEKTMRGIVKQLPIWTDWGEHISGVGEMSLANIIGGSVCSAEVDYVTGKKYKKKFVTIGDYSNPAKLWKRWGVGIVEGERQRRVKASIDEKKKFRTTGETSGDQLKAIVHGYNPTRRAILWNVGDCFVKAGNYYRKRYDQEKARQLELYPKVLTDKWGNSKKKNYSLARAHNRAMRYSTKLFLADLWNKWRELHGEGAFHKASRERD